MEYSRRYETSNKTTIVQSTGLLYGPCFCNRFSCHIDTNGQRNNKSMNIENAPVRIKSKYMAGDYLLNSFQYANGRMAIVIESKEGAQMAMLTVNIPDADLKDDEVIIKTWSENEGLLDSLVEVNVFEDTGKRIPTGFVEGHVCRFTDLFMNTWIK